MNDQSPPKRVTRARAAAKTDTGVKIATAASKAKVTRTASFMTRRARTENIDEDEEINNETMASEAPKTTRGRAKKAADVPEGNQHNEPEAMEPPKATRGRAKKTADAHYDKEDHGPKDEVIEAELPKTTRGRAKKQAVTQTEPGMQEEASAPAKPTRGRPKKIAAEGSAEPARSTRGRAKKVEVPEEDAITFVEEPPKKTTRARAVTISKATAPKKTVKFEEPDKENIVPPPANAKGTARVTEVGTGLKAKPVRKPMTAATRATRGRAKVEETEQKSSPLSPKKATQVTTAKEQGSDDELALNEKTPMKPLMKSPVRAPGSVLGTAKKLDFSNSITVHRAVGQDLTGSVMGSPARRPPQSPFKESYKMSPQRTSFAGSLMKSPIKLPLPPSKAAGSSTNMNFKSSFLQSPARRPQSPTKVSENGSPSRPRDTNPMISATPTTSLFKISRFATPRTLPKSAMRSGQMLPPSAFKNAATENSEPMAESDKISAPSLAFSGRLSSIMDREVDPTVSTSEAIDEETKTQSTIEVEQAGDGKLVDQEEPLPSEAMDEQTTTPPCSPPRNSTGAFALREVDENPFIDSDSEDELASGSPKYSPGPMNLFGSSPATPTPFTALSKTPKPQKSSFKDRSFRRSQIGFTPLAKQLTDWMASSPDKSDHVASDAEAANFVSTLRIDQVAEVDKVTLPSPAKSTFFEDEMSVRDELQLATELSDDMVIDERNFTSIDIVEEDLALAEEADEMSLLEVDEIEEREEVEQAMEMLVNTEELAFESIRTDVEQPSQVYVGMNQNDFEPVLVEAMVDFEETSLSTEAATLQPFEHDAIDGQEEPHIHVAYEPAPSEASQEYGNENVVPIDPVLLALSVPQAPATPAFKTPKRILAERVCHTVSKVPLKAAADDSLMGPSPVTRSASISRIAAPRPSSNLTRSNTVISYSPTKSSRKISPLAQQEHEDVIMQEAYATPTKSTAAWSNLGTPARTPRRDLNTVLLKGAVVFVDVHTSEGADASSLFTELLSQMGARCVKSWTWNPSSDDGSKIGITHIVFKDGGKRTLEKAKETGGVVTCVGVGWVLDCERENQWLPESPYSIDTAMIPRGGHRRRKSMEPRALANLNGTLLPSSSNNHARKSMSPMKNPNSFADTPLTSKSRRRDSVLWVRSTSPASPGHDDETVMLSPVLATPAPEFISAYGEEGLYGDETPSAQTPYFLKNDQLVQKTAPVVKFGSFEQGMGRGILSENKDETVMMRLMAARRKSLQWAPKVGSPLARGGSPMDRGGEWD